jgi:hypothetical protein
MRLRSIGPYLLVLVTGVLLATQVDRFPEVFPVHWGFDGRPNGFMHKSLGSLALPLVLIAVILLFIDMVVGAAARSGPEGRQMGEQVGRMLGPIRWTMAAMAPALAFAPLWGPNPALAMGAALVVVIIVQIVRAPRIATPPRPPGGLDTWLLYANRADPRLVVPKRSGLGWTFNFARPAAWVLLIASLAFPVVLLGLIYALR